MCSRSAVGAVPIKVQESRQHSSSASRVAGLQVSCFELRQSRDLKDLIPVQRSCFVFAKLNKAVRLHFCFGFLGEFSASICSIISGAD